MSLDEIVKVISDLSRNKFKEKIKNKYKACSISNPKILADIKCKIFRFSIYTTLLCKKNSLVLMSKNVQQLYPAGSFLQQLSKWPKSDSVNNLTQSLSFWRVQNFWLTRGVSGNQFIIVWMNQVKFDRRLSHQINFSYFICQLIFDVSCRNHISLIYIITWLNLELLAMWLLMIYFSLPLAKVRLLPILCFHLCTVCLLFIVLSANRLSIVIWPGSSWHWWAAVGCESWQFSTSPPNPFILSSLNLGCIHVSVIKCQ